MEGKGIFISSCSRRQLARRRPRPRAVRLQLMIVMVVLTVGLAALVAGHGGLTFLA